MNTKSIKTKLFNYFLYLIIIMTVLTLFSVLNTHSVKNEYKNMIKKFILLNDLSQYMTEMAQGLEIYSNSKKEEDLKKFYDSCEQITHTKNDVKPLITDKEDYSALIDIENLVTGFKDESYKAIEGNRTGSLSNFYLHYVEAKNISKYTESHIRQLIKNQLDASNDVYSKLNIRASVTEWIILTTIIIVSMFFITYSLKFSKEITEPIIKLSHISRELSSGNFDVEKVTVKSDDEVKLLADGFNIMVDNIKYLIKKIEDNAKFREMLKDEEMKNLIIHKALKDEQLKALQAQINPHFLFNTLNTIVNTAIIEGSYETERLIQSLADILRYSLRKSNNVSIIEDEVYIIKQYMFIQKARFTARLNFMLEEDESISSCVIPALTLQPIVENAFIHGIEGKEDGGDIRVYIRSEGDFIKIQVADNGFGIQAEKLARLKLLEESDGLNIKKGHVTGLGLSNVVQRLKLYFKDEVEFSIESIHGKGTDVYIKIPKVLEAKNV